MDVGHTENSGKVPNIDSKFTAAQWSEQLKLGSNSVRLTCWYADRTPAHIRVLQGHCSRPVANPTFSKTWSTKRMEGRMQFMLCEHSMAGWLGLAELTVNPYTTEVGVWSTACLRQRCRSRPTLCLFLPSPPSLVVPSALPLIPAICEDSGLWVALFGGTLGSFYHWEGVSQRWVGFMAVHVLLLPSSLSHPPTPLALQPTTLSDGSTVIQVSQQFFDKLLLNGLTAAGTGRKEGRQACYFSAAHLQKSKAVLEQKSWQPQVVPCVHHKWHTAIIFEIDLVKSTRDGSKMLSSIQSCCCSNRRRSSSMCCKSRWTRSEAIQADFRASGDWLLDPDQQQKRLDLIRNLVNSILQTPHRKELEEELLQYQEKGTEVKARTAELHSEQKNTDLSEIRVIDEMILCNVCEEHNANKDSRFANVEYFCRIFQQNRQKSWKNNGARHDSLERFAVANQEKRSDTALQSRR